jgi:hypothetical protein
VRSQAPPETRQPRAKWNITQVIPDGIYYPTGVKIRLSPAAPK